MRSSHLGRWTFVAPLFALGIGLAMMPAASADPDDVPAPAVPGPAPQAAGPVIQTDGASDSPAKDACKQFSAAMNYAASNYEEFAYASAGQGNSVDYNNPFVSSYNTTGRTALREAAAVALQASTTPGLQPDISAPMQSWAASATKMIFVMGLRGGGDSLNNTANDMNTDAHNVQMACAAAGTRA
jgi:hypothetical protein